MRRFSTTDFTNITYVLIIIYLMFLELVKILNKSVLIKKSLLLAHGYHQKDRKLLRNNVHIIHRIMCLDFIECFTTTFRRTHSWLNWVDEDDDEDGLKEKPEDTSKRLHRNKTRSTGSVCNELRG